MKVNKKYFTIKGYNKVYSNHWTTIKKNTNDHDSQSNQSNEEDKNYQVDDFFNTMNFNQERLTTSDMICSKSIDYSTYFQPNPDQINPRNLQQCFNGIIHHIVTESDNKFNTNEINFNFSGAENIGFFKKRNEKKEDICKLFDYGNVKSDFQIKPYINAFFGLVFKNIKVKPIAYSIRSSVKNNRNHLVSFRFEAFDDELKVWVVLDERVNENCLVYDSCFQLFLVKSVNNSFSAFRIVQTEPASDGFWGFSMSAFEIQGFISLKSDSNILWNNSFIGEKLDSESFLNSEIENFLT